MGAIVAVPYNFQDVVLSLRLEEGLGDQYGWLLLG